jgi:hypothetical protein
MFHITVGVAPSSGQRVDLTRDAELLKAAVLYGDKVTLCSPASSLMAQILALAQLGEQASDREKAEMFEGVFGGIGWPPWSAMVSENKENFRLYRSLLAEKRLPKEKLLLREQLKSKFRTVWRALADTVRKLGDDAGLSDVLQAVKSGTVEMHCFGTTLCEPGSVEDNTIAEFLEMVDRAVVGGDSYALLDDVTSGIVQAQIRAGRLTVTPPHAGRARQVGLASSLFERLPLFDRASLGQVLQIREELERPLRRFRGAVVSLSSTIASAPWDTDFPAEAEALFLKEVQPAVLDLEESIRANSFLLALCSRVANKPQVLVPPALALGLSQAARMPELAALSLGLGTSALTVLDVAAEWKRAKRANESNRLFFYYKAGQLLSERSTGTP